VDAASTLWLASAIAAFLLLPVGGVRMLAYRSGGPDHTPGMRGVALLALGLGTAALVVFAGLTVWFLVAGQRPV
jgi:hypothetical protein